MWKVVVLVFAAVSSVSSLSLIGGWQDVDPNDEGMKSLLNYAVVQHNRASNDAFLSQVADVVKAQKQVVAGMKYIITVNMVRSLCRKTSPQEVCGIQQDAQPYQCTFTVWTRPWINDIHVTASCPSGKNL